MADRARVWKRGALLAYIFTNQGYGSLGGSIVTLITLAAYKDSMYNHGHVSRVDGGMSSTDITGRFDVDILHFP